MTSFEVHGKMHQQTGRTRYAPAALRFLDAGLTGRFINSVSIWRCRSVSPRNQSRKAMSAGSSPRTGGYCRYQASRFVATIGNGATRVSVPLTEKIQAAAE